MSQWTFVTNHAVVLSLISRYPVITGHELALKIGISERAVRRIIAELQDAGYIKKKKEGRRMRYQVKHHAPLRHKTQEGKAVDVLLKVLSAQRKKQKNE
ncbi:MAG: winged helix-turn-helix domain-containing protein [Deltaproteobacteria bacterium]|nr:winged helix-turn-helix domain-containing protein [Deltaproteobacteria bacterium]